MNHFSRSVLLLATLAMGCGGEGEGRADEDLGNLVVSPAALTPKVDLDKASQDVPELLTALSLSHRWTGEVLGAHLVTGSSSVEVLQGDTIVETLNDQLTLQLDGEGRFQMTLDNSKEYGRHASFDGQYLYLRPRYGPYHKRVPQHEEEASDIRNEVYAGASDYLQLVAKQLELTDKGEKTLEGRAVREVSLKLAPKPRDVDEEKLSHKKWRNSIVVDSLSGQVSLDAETGAALYLSIAGAISYQREGQEFRMKIRAERTISKIGHEEAVPAPTDADVMMIEARHRELAERDALLKSIAPPARKAPTPKPAKSPPSPDPGN